jgi:hypothetical protein
VTLTNLTESDDEGEKPLSVAEKSLLQKVLHRGLVENKHDIQVSILTFFLCHRCFGQKQSEWNVSLYVLQLAKIYLLLRRKGATDILNSQILDEAEILVIAYLSEVSEDEEKCFIILSPDRAEEPKVASLLSQEL